MTQLLEGGVGRGRPLDFGRWPSSLTSAPQLLQSQKFFKIFIFIFIKFFLINAICLGGELGNAMVGGARG